MQLQLAKVHVQQQEDVGLVSEQDFVQIFLSGNCREWLASALAPVPGFQVEEVAAGAAEHDVMPEVVSWLVED